MKYYKRLKVFKSKRCLFDPFTMQAWSYDWWQFVGCFNGRVVFNNNSYSMQTRKHQEGVQDALKALGIKYKTVYIREGLQAFGMAISNTKFEIKELLAAINKPRSHAKTNKWRVSRIKDLEKRILWLEKFSKQKQGPYKGKLDFSKLPQPKPLTAEQKQRRLDKKTQRELRKTEFKSKTGIYSPDLGVYKAWVPQVLAGGKI